MVPECREEFHLPQSPSRTVECKIGAVGRRAATTYPQACIRPQIGATHVPRTQMTVQEVAMCLHIAPREVVRMAEEGILSGQRVRGDWMFRTGEVSNWVEANLQAMPTSQRRGAAPQPMAGLLISTALQPDTVALDLNAKTKASVVRELLALAVKADAALDGPTLLNALLDRERQGSTAIGEGVAIPHPSRPLPLDRPVVVFARTATGVPYGDPKGLLTDLFFLMCCPTQHEHLLYLGRLCRMLMDHSFRKTLRTAADVDSLLQIIDEFERSVCATHER